MGKFAFFKTNHLQSYHQIKNMPIWIEVRSKIKNLGSSKYSLFHALLEPIQLFALYLSVICVTMTIERSICYFYENGLKVVLKHHILSHLLCRMTFFCDACMNIVQTELKWVSGTITKKERMCHRKIEWCWLTGKRLTGILYCFQH